MFRLNNKLKTETRDNQYSHRYKFLVFMLVLFLLLLVEQTMAYYFPVVVADAVNSNLLMGAILGLTNLVALICDFVFPKIFRNRNWKYLLLLAVILQFGYPLFTNIGILTQSVSLFLVAAIFWNVYFELFAFSRQSYITLSEAKADYSRDWALVSMIAAITAIIGPFIGAQLIKVGVIASASYFILIESIALALVVYLGSICPDGQRPSKHFHKRLIKTDVLRQLSIQQLLGRRILPVLLMGTAITVLMSGFTTVSGLVGKQMFGDINMEWLVAFIVGLPTVFTGLIIYRLAIKRRKKLISQFCLLIASIILVSMYFYSGNSFLILIALGTCSLFVTTAWIMNEAVYSDLGERSGENKIYLTSLERIDDSIGFLLGPIIIGLLSDLLGYINAFVVLGIGLGLISLILLLHTPKKIRLPQKELTEINS